MWSASQQQEQQPCSACDSTTCMLLFAAPVEGDGETANIARAN